MILKFISNFLRNETFLGFLLDLIWFFLIITHVITYFFTLLFGWFVFCDTKSFIFN